MKSKVFRSLALILWCLPPSLSGCSKDDGSGTNEGSSGDGAGGEESASDGSGDGNSGDGSSGDGGSGESGAGDSTSSGDDETGSFVGDPDAGGPSLMCDPVSQDCPEGEKCTPASLDGDGVPEGSICSPIDPNPGQRGDECVWTGNLFSGVDNCDRGLMCFPGSAADAVPDGNGFCIGLCEGDPASPTCGDTAEICEVVNDGALPWCLDECDPLLQECRDGHACYPHTDRFACKIIGQPGAYGEPCGLANACDPGLYCATAAAVPDCPGTACCTEYCDMSMSDPNGQCTGMAGGQECVSAYGDNPATPGYENVGVCIIPQ